MRHLYLFERFDTISHLKERGIDIKQTRVIIDDKGGDVFFFLYNLSGQLIGYHKYNPKYPKTGQNKLDDPKLAKYFTWVTEEGEGRKIAVWGLESINLGDPYLFVTEGVFDSARIQEAGYPSIAVLCNNPSDSLKSWIRTLPQKKIVIYDNDKAGMRLKSVGDYSFTVPVGKDINDLSPEEARSFLEKCLKKINI